jgi:hypothetical protein
MLHPLLFIYSQQGCSIAAGQATGLWTGHPIVGLARPELSTHNMISVAMIASRLMSSGCIIALSNGEIHHCCMPYGNIF